MPDAVIVMLGWVGAVALGGLLAALLMKGRVRWGWLIAALVLMAIYDAVLTRGYGHIPLSFGSSHWNWEGKALAVLLSLAVASLPVIGWKRAGLTLKQDRRGLPGALILWACWSSCSLAWPSISQGRASTSTVWPSN
ncbi:MAG: hypothetical protein P0Y52_03085 [Candidatus Brevundimonas phytovorans]|nr:hypothetical protein [Brevundimonas sp.]WEK58541.1 MAG: hypothetical protein P0Y52_03085 [Brevundimonas sp.]